MKALITFIRSTKRNYETKSQLSKVLARVDREMMNDGVDYIG